MSRKAGSVIIRLDLRGQEDLKRRLEDLGPAGAKLGKELEAAMKPIQREGKLAKATIVEITDSVQDLAKESGPLGRILTALGPAGLAGAAGLGALYLAAREVFKLMGQSRDTALYARRLDALSDTAGLATARILEMRTALELVEEDAGRADTAVEEFVKRLGEFRATGQGEARDGLQGLGLGGTALDHLPVEDALDRVLEKLAEIEDPTRRLALADKLGLRDAATLLQRSSEQIQGILQTANDLNSALSDTLLNRFSEAGAAIRESMLRADRARQLGSSATLDLEVSRQQAIADFEERKAALLLERIPLQDRTNEQLSLQVDILERREATLSRSVGSNPYGTSGDLVRLGGLRARLSDINDELERRNQLEELNERSFMRDGLGAMFDNRLGLTEDDPVIPTLERRRELESLLATSLQSLQTPLQRVAQLEADLNEARAEYLRTGEDALAVTEAQIAAILELTRAQLGLNEAQTKAPGKTDPDAERRSRELALTSLRDELELEIARARGDEARVQMLEDQATLAARITAYEAAGLKTAEARLRAGADLARLAQARAAAQSQSLQGLRDAHDLTLARLAGDEASVVALERQAQIRAEIARLTELGLDAHTARDVAETRADERDMARRVGAFRSMIKDGLSDGFDAWVREGDVDAFGRALGASVTQYALDGLVDQLSGQAANWLFGGFNAAAEGAAHGAASGAAIATALTGAGAGVASTIAGAFLSAGQAVAAQLAAALQMGQARSAASSAAGALLPGLDSGGSVFIGGMGGIDTNVLSVNQTPVAFVSSDERIDVVPRLGGGAQGGAPILNQYFNLDARGAVTTQALLADFEARANQSASQGALMAFGASESNATQRARERDMAY